MIIWKCSSINKKQEQENGSGKRKKIIFSKDYSQEMPKAAKEETLYFFHVGINETSIEVRHAFSYFNEGIVM